MTTVGKKKAAVGGGGISGVVDLCAWWRYGDGIPTRCPTAPGITPPYVLPGLTGITAGVGIDCEACAGLSCVCEDEEWE